VSQEINAGTQSRGVAKLLQNYQKYFATLHLCAFALKIFFMKILISGASGLIGTHLIPSLKAKGHEIYTMGRENGFFRGGTGKVGEFRRGYSSRGR
jgi:hypothetical protein